jgi:hypothetical protein
MRIFEECHILVTAISNKGMVTTYIVDDAEIVISQLH